MFESRKSAFDNAPRHASRPQPIGTLVDQIMTRLGLGKNYFGWRIVSQWPEIVGEYYSRKTEAFRFDDGTLYVAVPDAAWRQMLAMDTPKILAMIHRLPYGKAVTDIRLVWHKRDL